MFSGRHEIPKHNGRLFIDRQGEAFVNLINYLRNGKYPVFRDKNEEINFFEELAFWQIPVFESSMYLLNYYYYSKNFQNIILKNFKIFIF